jgi:DNA-binding response OmpR family regulator
MATRILVINDTAEILELFKDILSSEGYDVVIAGFAINDIEYIERSSPDLIILDYIFGNERAGWQTLQKLKMLRSTAQIPVVVCTAAKREIEELEGHLKAMGVGIVIKPFDVDVLLRVIIETLDSAKRGAYRIGDEEQPRSSGSEVEPTGNNGNDGHSIKK